MVVSYEHGSDVASNPRGEARRVGRRALCAALVGGVGLSLLRPAVAEDEKPGSEERPQPGDLFVFAEGDREGQLIAPGDVPDGGPQIPAWPMDQKTRVVRDGSRLNQVLLLRLDPGKLDDDTRARSVDGIVAYSAICTHAGCPVTGWLKAEQGDKDVLKCFCHNSEFNPRESAQVVFGPAPRRWAALPKQITDGCLTIAGTFVG